MLKLNPDVPAKTILLLGAHCDDIEIGCGGTILQLIDKHPNTKIVWNVFSSSPEREEEARSSAEAFLQGCNSAEINIERFRNGHFPYEAAEIKKYFENLKSAYEPDIIFTHQRNDLHQDHRTISELTLNTFRNNLILEYEIPKYDGDLGQPNTFMPIEPATMNAKIDNILKHFKSQQQKQWFSPETFQGLMRLRGIECNSETGYAEAFYGRKISLSF